jgi:cell wall-associated NlpC family hydrolase
MTTLTTVGLGITTATPASAAPDNNDIDSVQARVDRLTEKADAAQKRHDSAQASLNKSHHQLDKITSGIKHQRRLIESLRTKVANTVVDEYAGTDEYDGTAGASAPATPLSTDSEVMVTNVTLASEDAGQRGETLADSSVKVAKLTSRRTAVRDQITMLSGLEKNLRRQEAKVGSRAAAAGAVLENLQAEAEKKRIAELGGPAVAYAKAQIGKSYVYGAAGPDSFDCSGLTMAAWSQAGVSLPHSSSAQYSSGQHISESELQPGDLVFYYSPISHVGMYIGDGQIVNALNPGSGVQVSGLHDMPYSGAVRVG